MLPLTPRQCRAFNRLIEAKTVLATFDGHKWSPKLTANELFCVARGDAIEEMDRAIGATIRTGLYPTNLRVRVVVEPWLDALRELGQRDALRSIHKGLEKGAWTVP